LENNLSKITYYSLLPVNSKTFALSMIDFNNTRIAFAIKSSNDLKRAHFLFRTIASPFIVATGELLSTIALRLRIPVNWAVKPTLYKQFVGGETIDDCIPAVRQLEKFNVKAILDYSVEGGESEEYMEAVLQETLRTIDYAAKDANVPFAVFKPTAFSRSYILEKASAGDKLSETDLAGLADFQRRVHTLCKHAAALNVPIMIDAEDVHYQAIIDKVTMEMMEKFNKEKAIVFNTYQMYRTDRLAILKKDLETARQQGFFLGAKFVRGAYMERERRRAEKMGYASPIHPDKPATDRHYDDALSFSVENIDRISIFNGTHNEKSCHHLMQLMEKHGLAKNDPRIWTSQLYGMSDHISFNMADAGYNVVKYMPYGPVKSVLPYLLRRAEENTSIAGQTSRELNLIETERRRRRSERANG
jgi:proline dehydrogenase